MNIGNVAGISKSRVWDLTDSCLGNIPRAEVNGAKNDGRVDRQAVECHVQSEPWIRNSDEKFQILPLTEVAVEVREASGRRSDFLDNGVRVGPVTSLHDVFDIVFRLFDIPFNVHCETGRLRYRKAEVKGKNCGDTTQSEQQTPHEID